MKVYIEEAMTSVYLRDRLEELYNKPEAEVICWKVGADGGYLIEWHDTSRTA